MPSKRKITVSDLVGTKLPQRAALLSMKQHEKQLVDGLNLRHSHLCQMARIRKRLVTPLHLDRGAGRELKKELKEAMHAIVQRRKKLSPPISKPPQVRIFAGFGAVNPPPYDFTWSTSPALGAAVSDAAANSTLATIACDCRAPGPSPGSAAAGAAVGIYFYPPADGVVLAYSAPSFVYGYFDLATWGNVNSYAFLGIQVAAYDLNLNFIGNEIDYRKPLWNDNFNRDAGASPGTAMNVIFPADTEHQYILWIWCGMGASADGFRTTVLSTHDPDSAIPGPFEITQPDAAVAALAASVPYIGWDLLG